jgi:hypothetical protein
MCQNFVLKKTPLFWVICKHHKYLVKWPRQKSAYTGTFTFFLWSPISGKYLTQEMLNLAFEIVIKS